MLKKMTMLASESVIAIAFYLPMEQLDEEDQPMQKIANEGAEASGNPFVSFFPIEEIVKLANEIGLKEIQTISTKDMTEKYFAKILLNMPSPPLAVNGRPFPTRFYRAPQIYTRRPIRF
ncbi:hypothetical protein SDC9_195909 [bioreactor metagenome]|uniref:Uncharacterized protein n=1 Tax=bioreactor metagenome TaxID=1076179 RepID=A0A645IBT9_9ZZZZ